MCKTPSIILKVGKYVAYMIQDANVKKITMHSEKISLLGGVKTQWSYWA